MKPSLFRPLLTVGVIACLFATHAVAKVNNTDPLPIPNPFVCIHESADGATGCATIACNSMPGLPWAEYQGEFNESAWFCCYTTGGTFYNDYNYICNTYNAVSGAPNWGCCSQPAFVPPCPNSNCPATYP